MPVVLMLVMLPTIASANRIEAVWKPQRFSFLFVSQSVIYTCDALQRMLRAALLTLGAHERMIIDARECSRSGGMRLHVTFMSPIEATEENIRAIVTFDTEAQLIARLRGIELPTAEELPRFPAEWQTISLGQNRELRLDASDCELIEQIRRQLLPRMATRQIPKRLLCVPGRISNRAPRLKLAALVASTE